MGLESQVLWRISISAKLAVEPVVVGQTLLWRISILVEMGCMGIDLDFGLRLVMGFVR